MRLILFFLIFSALASPLLAQEIEELPKDEAERYTYYEVVNTAVSADSLKLRLLGFLTKNKKEIKLKPEEQKNILLAEGRLVIQKSVAMLSHPSGEIKYQFNFEAVAGKYRFWLTNFEFIPYQKDRYGNFVASTTVGVPLEKEPKKLNAAQWQDYRLQAAKYAAAFAKRLKDDLANTPKITSQPFEKKVITKTWR